MDEHLEIIKQAVVERDKAKLESSVRMALEVDIEPEKIVDDALIPAMDTVGNQFASSEIFVPEMMVSAMLMKQGLEMVKPLLKGGESKEQGVVLIGTVKGDMHDIGKNIVKMMLEGGGFKVIDLGVDLSVQTIINGIMEHKPQVLGLSALLTTTMPEMQNVIDALAQQGLREKIKVIVGGAPVDNAFAKKIGADGYGKDAAEAVALAKKFGGPRN